MNRKLKIILVVAAMGMIFLPFVKSASFSNTDSMSYARNGHTATVLQNGKVLVVGGQQQQGGGWLSTAELYDLATGTWTTTGNLTIARAGHTATLLPNGQVLVVGGFDTNNNPLSSAELYNPVSGLWTNTGALNIGRSQQTATVLPNGQVLVAGGYGNGGWPSATELYDPDSGTWSIAGALNTARYRHTTTLLANGKVLVAGGSNPGNLASSELYDPASRTWTITGTLNTARIFHTAALLINGQVVVAGGFSSGGTLSSAEIYDPAIGTWTTTNAMGNINARGYHTATLLPNGNVLVAGGELDSDFGTFYRSNAVLYIPATGTWTNTGALNVGRELPTATLLLNGEVLVVGGYYKGNCLSNAELYDGGLVFQPLILTQPQSQFVPVGSNAIFNVVAYGQQPMNYQWRFNGSPISGATNASLLLTNIQTNNAGSYSVVVSNPYGSVTSTPASLKITAVNISQACYLMTVTPLPPKQGGKTNLVVVTHGWVPSWEWLSPDVMWAADLSAAMQYKISGDWQAEPYFWTDQAKTLLADSALDNAKSIGTQIGRQIVEQGWQHVHLIAHSAGSALIQAAADVIRSNSPGTIIQTTFLDPYLGTDYRGLAWYGSNANWSDAYDAYNFWTDQLGEIILRPNLTYGTIANAYNVDVTWVDPSKTVHTSYCYVGGSSDSTPMASVPCGQQALSSHGWPIDFYTGTVLGTETNCAAGFGFPLSIEASGWGNIGNYHHGLAPNPLCGSSSLTQNQFSLKTDSQLQIGLMPNATSSFGAGLAGNSGFELSSVSQTALPNGIHPLFVTPSTNSPAWLAVGLTITNPVNFVQFDAAFTDTNSAQGLLTVYWDTNQIGTMDERVADAGLQTHRFFLPVTVTNDVYVLGFRLDSFSNTLSSVTITNVATGFVGVTQPITLGVALFTNNTPVLQLTAASNYNYLVQSSTNLIDWTPTALLVNSNGTTFFADPTASNSPAKYYRALMP